MDFSHQSVPTYGNSRFDRSLTMWFMFCHIPLNTSATYPEQYFIVDKGTEREKAES